MADAIFSFALENLAHLATDEVKLLRSTKEEANKLAETLRDIQASLHDAEMKQFKDKDVQEWLSKLKYMEYEVDDVLDEWKVKSHLLSTNSPVWNFSTNNPVWSFFTQCTCCQQLFLHHNIGKKIKNVNKKLDQIVIEKNRFGFQQNTAGFEVDSSRMTYSSLVTSEVIGRKDDKNKIINMLLNEGSSKPSDIPVISIVGMGGYGKTTLAKVVYNDEKVKSQFDELIWVYVSVEFDVVKIIKMIIEAIKKEHPTATGLEALSTILRDNLKGKRFLLVLDDVWNEEFGKWVVLVDILKTCGENRRMIVVTTRNKKVAEVMNSSCTHELGPLFFKDCLLIFRQIAGINEGEFPELMKVGIEIVKKCEGIPLAIKSVAGALGTAKTKKNWENALNDEIWNQPKGGILPSLMLSYYRLSPPLKRCFQYCAIFPKGYEIEKKVLVHMWVAQGYIPHDENKMEDTGNEYFKELLEWSLLQEPQIDVFGNITSCKMHDLVYDLAQLVTNGESAFIDGSKDDSAFNSRKLRHCTCTWSGERFDKIDSAAFKNLRTLVFNDDTLALEQLQSIRVLSLRNSKLLDSIGKLVHLRYLDLPYQRIKVLPKSIGKLWNLRYLILSYSRVEILSESISDLPHLRLLDLNYSRNLRQLPSGIKKMTSLRGLGIDCTDSLKTLPAGIGKLTSLERLHRFIVTEGECNLSELRDLNHLQESLCIENLEAASIDEAVNAKLEDKSYLQQLELSWSDRTRPSIAEGVLDALRSHPSIQKLKIFEYPGSKFPSWVGEPSFSRLVTVSFWARNSTELPALGNLPELRYLYIYVPKVRKVGSEFMGSKNGFPKLESLYIDGLVEWEEWEEALLIIRVGWMPCLSEFWITGGKSIKLTRIFSKELTEVEIIGLEKLSGLESIPLSVQKFKMSSCPGELINNLPSLPKLEDLTIEGMTTELSCDLLRFIGLKTLRIAKCYQLISLPEEFMNSMKGLEELYIHDCPKLDASWKTGIVAHMPCLRRLEIDRCDNLKVLPCIVSKALKEIHIWSCPNLSEVGSIPPSTEILELPANLLSKLPRLPVLNHLITGGDKEVMKLSNNLITFTELQTLVIHYCSNLRSFPEEMGSLKKLHKLEISLCPNLGESCKVGGDQWSKIAHIPHIEIDRKIIQENA